VITHAPQITIIEVAARRKLRIEVPSQGQWLFRVATSGQNPVAKKRR
jgi:hypothetical protein